MVEADLTSSAASDISLLPKLIEGEWRADLTWGAKPLDLDAYAKWGQTSVGSDNPSMKANNLKAVKTRDATAGFGPETIFLSNVGQCTAKGSMCDIRYEVSDMKTKSLSGSKAEVTVFTSSGKVATLKIGDCPKSVSKDGVWWHAFTLDGKTGEMKWDCASGKPAPLAWGSTPPMKDRLAKAKGDAEDKSTARDFCKEFCPKKGHACCVRRNGEATSIDKPNNDLLDKCVDQKRIWCRQGKKVEKKASVKFTDFSLNGKQWPCNKATCKETEAAAEEVKLINNEISAQQDVPSLKTQIPSLKTWTKEDLLEHYAAHAAAEKAKEAKLKHSYAGHEVAPDILTQDMLNLKSGSNLIQQHSLQNATSQTTANADSSASHATVQTTANAVSSDTHAFASSGSSSTVDLHQDASAGRAKRTSSKTWLGSILSWWHGDASLLQKERSSRWIPLQKELKKQGSMGGSSKFIPRN